MQQDKKNTRMLSTKSGGENQNLQEQHRHVDWQENKHKKEWQETSG